MFSDPCLYYYDLKEKKVLNECNFCPANVNQSDMRWLYALNNMHMEDYESGKTGKWMIFLTKDRVNATWDKIKQAVTNGDLWQSKVSTTSSEPGKETHAIMVYMYTYDYFNLDDVIGVLDFLESSGIKSPETVIKYKTDEQTHAGIYSGGAQKPWIYKSDTIRQKTARLLAMINEQNQTAGGSNRENWRAQTNQQEPNNQRDQSNRRQQFNRRDDTVWRNWRDQTNRGENKRDSTNWRDRSN